MTGKREKKCLQERETPGQKECKQATEKAMNLLLQQDRTRKELEERLYRAGFSEQESEYAMNYVTSYGYLDDLRYAGNYIAFHKGNRSRKELRYRLLKKGVEPEVLTTAFEEYEEDDESTALAQVLRKRLRGKQLAEIGYDEKNRITAYLARKGYPLPAIKRVMREWNETESNKNL